MPNYRTHARWGRVGAVLTAFAVGGGLLVTFDSPVLALAGAVGAGSTTFVGSIFPDIDHDESVPRQKAVRGVQLLVWLGVVSLALLSWDLLVEAVETGYREPIEAFLANHLYGGIEIHPSVVTTALVLLVGVGLAGIVDPVFSLVTFEHRGWTHNVWVVTVLTAATAGWLWLVTSGQLFGQALPVERQVLVLSVVATFFFGVLVHLGLDDEID